MFDGLLGHGAVAKLGMVLLHSLWQGLFVCAVVALILEYQRQRSASNRYVTCCMGLVVLLIAPLVTFVWLSPDEMSPRGVRAVAFSSNAESVPPEPLSMVAPSGTPIYHPASRLVVRSTSSFPVWRPSLRQVADWCAYWLAIVWLAIVPVLVVRLVANYFRVRTLGLRYSMPVSDEVEGTVRRLCRRMGYVRPVRLLVSARVMVPMVVGWVKPVILLPSAYLASVPPNQLEALLAHELAHLRRLDPLVNVIQCLTETVLFYNPFAWWLSRKIRAEREFCCDDYALAMGTCPTLYAESLLALAEAARGGSVCAVSSTGGALLTRVRRVLGVSAKPVVSVRTGMPGAVLVTLLVLGLCVTYVKASVRASDLGSSSRKTSSEEVRYFTFPTDRSVGEICFRTAGADYSPNEWDLGYRNGWWTGGRPAKGVVAVPAGEEICLSLTSPDLSVLNALPPDSLVAFECESSELVDADLAPLSRMTGLRAISLTECHGVTDQALEILGGLTELESLQLQNTSVRTLSGLKVFRKLRELDLADSDVGDEGMAALAAADLPDLGHLCIAGLTLSDRGFAAVAGLRTVKALLLGATKVNAPRLGCLARSSSIEYLSAREGALDDASLAGLRGMTSLRVLSIPYTQVTDQGMGELAALPSLERLIVYGTEVTEACLPVLATSKTLWEIRASNTGIPYATLKEWRGRNYYKRRSLAEPIPDQRSTNPAPLKVGFVLSDFQATGPHWMPDPYGYQTDGLRGRIIRLLTQANVDLYAVIEPGTERLGDLPDVLAAAGLTNKLVDLTDPGELLRLDVVCMWRHPDILPESVAALRTAVRQGLGLVANSNVGNVFPALGDPALMDLFGHTSQAYLWWGNGERSFEVVAEHPILKGIAPGTILDDIRYNGAYDPSGPPQGTLLIGPTGGERDTFYPMYLRDYGEGRLVVNAFWNIDLGGIPEEVFYMRCVNWAAGRDVDTQY